MLGGRDRRTYSFPIMNRHGRVWCGIGAICLMLWSSGCATPHDAQSPAGMKYSRGAMTLVVDASFTPVWRALLAALNASDVTLLDSSKTSTGGVMDGRTPELKTVKVNVRRLSEEKTEVRIKIDSFGNSELTHLIHERFRVALEPRDDQARFQSLIQGPDLSGWKNPYTWGKAQMVGDEIHLTSDRKFFLVTEKTYGDFIFEGEVWLPPGKANSGFMFRAHVQTNHVFGYQAEVDSDPKRQWSGGLYDEGRRMWFISPDGKDPASIAAFRQRAGDAFRRDGWNLYRITCQGPKIRIEVNGVVTTEIEDSMDARGVIGLQHHGEKGQTYRFRNLRLKELAP